MDYQKHYIIIIENRKANPLPKDAYGERHHVIPLSEGGPNRSWNIVKLTAKEHYVCHLLLEKIYSDRKMRDAVTMMQCKNRYQKRDFKFNSRLYEKLRIRFGIQRRGKNHPNFGKHMSEKTKAALIKANKGRKFTEVHKQRLRDANIGRKVSDDARRKVGDATRRMWKNPELREKILNSRSEYFKTHDGPMKGRKHGPDARKKMGLANLGRKQSDEEKEKRSESLRKFYAEHPEVKEKQAEMFSNLFWITDGVNETRIECGESIPEGWHKGRLETTGQKISSSSKKTPVVVFKDGRFYGEFKSLSSAGRELNMSPGNIYNILYGKYNSKRGFTFKFKAA